MIKAAHYYGEPLFYAIRRGVPLWAPADNELM